jgi:hypothetical protein
VTDLALAPACLEEPVSLGGEALQVYSWRLEELQRAGYTHAYACRLAEDGQIDLHRACLLIAAGCAQYTAYRILS